MRLVVLDSSSSLRHEFRFGGGVDAGGTVWRGIAVPANGMTFRP